MFPSTYPPFGRRKKDFWLIDQAIRWEVVSGRLFSTRTNTRLWLRKTHMYGMTKLSYPARCFPFKTRCGSGRGPRLRPHSVKEKNGRKQGTRPYWKSSLFMVGPGLKMDGECVLVGTSSYYLPTELCGNGAAYSRKVEDPKGCTSHIPAVPQRRFGRAHPMSLM